MLKNKITIGRKLKWIGWGLIIISLLLAILVLGWLFSAGYPGEILAIPYFTFILPVYLPLPIGLGVTLILWGKYIKFKTRKLKIILIIFTAFFLLFVIRGITSTLYIKGVMFKQTSEVLERKIEEAIKTEKVENCFKIHPLTPLPYQFSLFLFAGLSNKLEPYLGLCINQIAKIKKDETLCQELIIYATSYYDSCITGVATVKKDETLCEKAGKAGIGAKYECYAAVAIAKEDIILCEQAHERFGRCYKELAIIKKDESLCEKLGNDPTVWDRDYRKGECWAGVGVVKGDIALCEKAQELAVSKGDKCYKLIAFSTDNLDLCQKIKIRSDDWKECLEKRVICNEIKGLVCPPNSYCEYASHCFDYEGNLKNKYCTGNCKRY